MTIKTVRGLVKWLMTEYNKAILEDSVLFDRHMESGAGDTVDYETPAELYARIKFFRRAHKSVKTWTYKNEPLNEALDRLMRLARKMNAQKYLQGRFPKGIDT